MPKALAVALLLSACLPAAARGFFFTSLDANSEPDSAWWATANACHFQSDSTAALRLNAGIRLDSLLNFALDHELDPIKAMPQPPLGVLRVVSSDKRLVAYSFAVPMTDGQYRFFAVIHGKKSKATTLTSLHSIDNWDSYFSGNSDQWPGGLIYAIGANTHRRSVRYTALMYAPNAQSFQKKWVEPWILGRTRSTVENRQLPSVVIYFGARVFNLSDFGGEHFLSPPKRLILRYSPESIAGIRFSPSFSEIQADVVAPMREADFGNYSRYGPTMSVDFLVYKKGKWSLSPVENP